MISSFYLIKTLLLKNKNDSFYNSWTLLLVVNVFGFLFSADLSNSSHISMFRNILACSLPFYPCYYISRAGKLKSDHLVAFFLSMLPLFILQYFNKDQVLSEEASSNIVNNAGYLFVGLIPYVFLINRSRLFSVASMMVIMFFIIQSSKRGAIICGAIGLIIFFYYQIRTIEKRKRIQGYTLAIIGIFILGFFSYQTMVNNEFLIDRVGSLAEGESSGREAIYMEIFTAWLNSNHFLNLLFGFGFASSLTMTGGKFAHNDWLELLSNFGLLGVLIYFLLFFALFAKAFYKKWLTEKRIIILLIALIWFSMTLFSMWYTSTSGFLQAVLLGYLFGDKNGVLK